MASSVIRKVVGRDLTHILYHSFAATPIPHIEPLFGCKIPQDFERDLDYLQSRFQFVSHDDIVAHRENGRKLPPRAVAVSFDDGFVEGFTIARPMLLARGLPATFFVCNSFIDNRALMFRNKIALCVSRIAGATNTERVGLLAGLRRHFGLAAQSRAEVQRWLFGLDFARRNTIDAVCECLGVNVRAFLSDRRPYMSRDQIGQLHADGFTIGAHTTDHPDLTKLADWNDVRRQVSESCDLVRDITGRTRVPFAFPFNGLEIPRSALAALRDELGTIDLMYDTNDFMRDWPFIVNRICGDPPNRASTHCSNLPMLLGRAYAFEPLRAVRRRIRAFADSTAKYHALISC